ncbi:MAG: fibronectin type III domain-containing protein [Armatimonadota bacterium]
MAPLVFLLALGDSGFYLPGSQPNVNGYAFQSTELCQYCHGNSHYAYDPETGGVDPHFTAEHEPHFQWAGSMMAQAARDPVFRAALTIAEQDAPGAGQFCWRCHSPTAWLEARSQPYDGSNFEPDDLQGVQCDVCHRLVDPLSDEGRSLSDYPVPGYGNGMMVLSNSTAKRGPRADSFANHEWLYSSFHSTGHFCGMCHDVSNPRLASDARNQPPHEYMPITRIYSEWLLSDYPQRGVQCQTCHMPRTVGKAAEGPVPPVRSDLRRHTFAGGNYWVPQILPLFWEYDDRTLDALTVGRYRAIEMVRCAAKLSLASPKKYGNITLRVTNLTGHKFPTGDPESRRAWLHVEFLDAQGNVIGESGRYDFATATLVKDPKAKIYHVQLGEGNRPTFHMMRANRVLFDNRIPPMGFRRSAFAQRQAAPVGATYRDGQFWDDTTYQLPPGTVKVRATLYYQVMTREYIEFLRNTNTTDDWGERLYQAWLATDKAPPIAVATLVYPHDKQPPTPPKNLVGNALSSTRIQLRWRASSDNEKVVYYEIWRRAPYEGKFRRIASTFSTETTFDDAGCHPDTEYEYYVRAVDMGGNVSSISNTVRVRTQP